MTKSTLPTVTLEFLLKLRKIDKRTLTVRDVLVLYAIIERPGIAGMDIANTLGFQDRSSIASNIQRLEREGYIEDRRTHHRKAVPAILHPLAAGVAFWNEIKP